MSTLFVTSKPVSFEAICTFGEDGVHAGRDEEDDAVFLTDGKNFLLVYPADDESPVTFERCGDNDPSAIITAIEKAFDVTFISEHDEEFKIIETTDEYD